MSRFKMNLSSLEGCAGCTTTSHAISRLKDGNKQKTDIDIRPYTLHGDDITKELDGKSIELVQDERVSGYVKDFGGISQGPRKEKICMLFSQVFDYILHCVSSILGNKSLQVRCSDTIELLRGKFHEIDHLERHIKGIKKGDTVGDFIENLQHYTSLSLKCWQVFLEFQGYL